MHILVSSETRWPKASIGTNQTWWFEIQLTLKHIGLGFVINAVSAYKKSAFQADSQCPRWFYCKSVVHRRESVFKIKKMLLNSIWI